MIAKLNVALPVVETTDYIDKTYAKKNIACGFNRRNATKIDNENASRKNVQRYVSCG